MAKSELITLRTYCQSQPISVNLMQYLIYQNDIKAVSCQHQANLYQLDDLNRILKQRQSKHAHQRRQTKQYQILNKKPNTDQIYNPKIDYSPYQLAKELGRISYHAVFEWIKTDLVPYQMDHNNKFYFTAEQVEQIKHIFRKIPKGYISNQNLAKELNTDPHRLTRWTSYRLIPKHRIIGRQAVFYDGKQADYIRKTYQE